MNRDAKSLLNAGICKSKYTMGSTSRQRASVLQVQDGVDQSCIINVASKDTHDRGKRKEKEQSRTEQKMDGRTPYLGVLGMRHLLLLATVLGLIRTPVGAAGELVAAALPGSNLADVHVVELLEGTALAFDDEEVHDEDAREETAGKHVTVPEVDGAGDEGREETDQEVPGPVGRGGNGHTLGTVLGGEQFGDNGPDHGAPGHCVGRDEQTGHDNHSLTGAGGVLRVLAVQHKMAERREDHEHDKHPGGTEDE